MPTLEEVSPDVTELAEKVNKLGMNSDSSPNSGSDDESDDEFHDACDRASNPGEQEKDEEFTEAELLVSKSTLRTDTLTDINDRTFQELILKGETSKSEGNQLYVKEQWEDAKQRYLYGLTCAPKRKAPPAPPPPIPNADSDTPEEKVPAQQEANTPAPTEIEKRAAGLRAQLYCNIGACCVKLVRSSPLGYSTTILTFILE